MIMGKSNVTYYYSYRNSLTALFSSITPPVTLHLMQESESVIVRRLVIEVWQPIILLQHLDSIGCLETLRIRQLNDLQKKNINVTKYGWHIHMNFTSVV